MPEALFSFLSFATPLRHLIAMHPGPGPAGDRRRGDRSRWSCNSAFHIDIMAADQKWLRNWAAILVMVEQ